MTSLLMLTIDRYLLTKETLERNLIRSDDADVELLVADNGSSDKRIVQWMPSVRPLQHHRVNSKNEGVAKSFNQLYLRSKGEYIVLLGNDILLPPGWLTTLKEYAESIPKAGIIGMDWGHGSLPPLTSKFGVLAHWLTPKLDRVFGVWLVKRSLIDTIGFFHDGFQEYGIEDTDFNTRVNGAGFNSCYVPNNRWVSTHLGVGEHDKDYYRKMKDEAIQKNCLIYNRRVEEKFSKGDFVEPLPEMRDAV